MSKIELNFWIIKLLLVLSIIGSISIIYYTYMIKKDYIIFTNPDGPDTSDYFEIDE